ncbi:hypothetical protein PHMEG_0004228 [Phytophthora megakarya]|uniref:Uncharacterized protein n=1 Tax=Phytophthora megakarya TaxID=4795 RepID=A0A225WVZ4_9STRA|nr:hypothetical protein PHMEG_0004228 [Phytophthora megakarya]
MHHQYFAYRVLLPMTDARFAKEPTGLKVARVAAPAGSIRINGLLEDRYLPDTGTDRSIVPQRIMDALFAVQPLLSPTSLRTSVLLEMADGLILRSVPCLMITGGSDELSLGRDVLRVSASTSSSSSRNWPGHRSLGVKVVNVELATGFRIRKTLQPTLAYLLNY